MSKLLRADFFRILKSKLTIISLALAAGLPIVVFGAMFGFDAFLQAIGGTELTDLGVARSLIGSSYSLSNNIGIVIPIFSAIFVCFDVSQGTLRNKLITGSSRIQVYLSHLITSIVYCVVIINIYFAFNFIYLCLFFGAGSLGTDAAIYMLQLFVCGTLTFVFIASIATFFSLALKSVAPAIIFTIILGIALSSATQLVVLLQSMNNNSSEWTSLIPTFSLSLLSYVSKLSVTQFVLGIASPIIFATVFTALGIYIFKTKDLK